MEGRRVDERKVNQTRKQNTRGRWGKVSQKGRREHPGTGGIKEGTD